MKTTVPPLAVREVTFQLPPTSSVLAGAESAAIGVPVVPMLPVTVRVLAPLMAEAFKVPEPLTLPPMEEEALARARVAVVVKRRLPLREAAALKLS